MTDTQLCICCQKNPVTWPRVCEECVDQAAQDELASQYGYHFEIDMGEPGSALVDVNLVTGWECRTCGMIYDGGTRCSYCNDPNPLDDPELEGELDR